MEKKKKVPANQKPDGHTIVSGEEAEMSAKKSDALEKADTEPVYQITCCNPVSESFGGVTFEEGVASTKDGFTASWFGNKEGYAVSKSG